MKSNLNLNLDCNSHILKILEFAMEDLELKKNIQDLLNKKKQMEIIL